MQYHIYVEDIKIASFVNEFDRDRCLDALEQEFTDCTFMPKDD